jgi:hypothetical protein
MKARLILLLVFACLLATQLGAVLDRLGFHEGGW